MRGFLVWVLIVGLVSPAAARASQEQADKELAAGIRQVEEGDLENAVVTLGGVVKRLAGNRSREADLASAHLYLAMAHLGLSQMETAKANVREAWKNQQNLVIDPRKFPPILSQYLEEAKKESARTTPLPVPSPAPPAPATEAPPEMRAPDMPAPSAGVNPWVDGTPVGTRVRVTAPGVTKSPLVGTVSSLDGSSMTVSPDRGDRVAVPVSAISAVERSLGKSSASKRMLWTVPLLAVSLAAVGYAAGASEEEVCETWYGDQYCWMEESNAPKQKSAALGAGIGVGVGVMFSWLTGRQERWTKVAPVGVRVVPGVDGTFAAAVTFRF